MAVPVIPRDIYEKLVVFCEDNELGLSIVSHESYFIILVGDGSLSAAHIHILGAHAMLEGVISGEVSSKNEDAKERQKHPNSEKARFN